MVDQLFPFARIKDLKGDPARGKGKGKRDKGGKAKERAPASSQGSGGAAMAVEGAEASPLDLLMFQLNHLADVDQLGTVQLLQAGPVKVKLIFTSIQKLFTVYGVEKTQGTAPHMNIERLVSKDLKKLQKRAS